MSKVHLGSPGDREDVFPDSVKFDAGVGFAISRIMRDGAVAILTDKKGEGARRAENLACGFLADAGACLVADADISMPTVTWAPPSHPPTQSDAALPFGLLGTRFGGRGTKCRLFDRLLLLPAKQPELLLRLIDRVARTRDKDGVLVFDLHGHSDLMRLGNGAARRQFKTPLQLAALAQSPDLRVAIRLIEHGARLADMNGTGRSTDEELRRSVAGIREELRAVEASMKARAAVGELLRGVRPSPLASMPKV